MFCIKVAQFTFLVSYFGCIDLFSKYIFYLNEVTQTWQQYKLTDGSHIKQEFSSASSIQAAPSSVKRTT